MKNVILVGAALLLAACSGDEPAPAATEDAPVSATEETVAEPEVVEETLEIVEESASARAPAGCLYSVWYWRAPRWHPYRPRHCLVQAG